MRNPNAILASAIEVTTIHIKASGPVSPGSIERYLIDQVNGVDCLNARKYARAAIGALLADEVIERYPDCDNAELYV